MSDFPWNMDENGYGFIKVNHRTAWSVSITMQNYQEGKSQPPKPMTTPPRSVAQHRPSPGINLSNFMKVVGGWAVTPPAKNI